MKHHIKSIIRGIILITLGLLCKNNVWYFDQSLEMDSLWWEDSFISGTLLVFLKKKMENGFGKIKNRPNPRLWFIYKLN